MKKIFSTVWIAFSVVTLLTCCCKDKLEQAILDGYNNAFSVAGVNEKVRLSEGADGDFDNICRWFQTYADEQKDSDYNNNEWRWDFIKTVLYDNFEESEVERVDATQWIGKTPDLPLLVDVYLDNTSSMKGYIKHDHVQDPVFVNVFHAIDDYSDRCLRKENIETNAIRSYYTQSRKGKDANGKPITIDEIAEINWEGNGGMKSQLDLNKMSSFTDSYKLDTFLDSISRRIEKDKEHRHLAFFITDGIPSGSNENVKPGGTYNIEPGNISEQIKDIRRIAARLSNAGLGVSVYQFEGDFYGGRYWYYDNSTYPKDKDIDFSAKIKRPFYVIVLGDVTMTNHFKEKVKEGLDRFKPLKEVHFTNTMDEIQISVSDNNGKSAEVSGEDEYLFSNMKESKLQVFIGFPFVSLPSFYADEDTMTNMITLDVDGRKLSSAKKERDKLLFGPISMDKNSRINAKITFHNESPSWTIATNIKNDKTQSYVNGTFNFSILIDGLREGYVGENNVLFVKEISIKRED